MRLAIALMLLLGVAQVATAKPTLGTWIQEAAFAQLQPPKPPMNCVCAPDPVLPNPACVLCYCDVANAGSVNGALPARNTTACALVGATKTKLSYDTGAEYKCLCASDPFFSDPNWVLCKCPLRPTSWSRWVRQRLWGGKFRLVRHGGRH